MARRGMLISMLNCALVLGVTGCSSPSEPGQSGPATTIVPVQGVVVRPQSVQLLAIGETKQLAVRISPTNATDRAITWESSDTTVATVDNAGRVTAKGAGLGVFVTAYTHDGHFQASANVSVVP